MRISCDLKDQGFHPDVETFRVTWNNNPVLGVITADEELGLVRYFAEGPHGGYYEKVLLGVVKIERLN